MSTRPLEISVQTVALAPKGVEITSIRDELELRAGRDARPSSSRRTRARSPTGRASRRESSRSWDRASTCTSPGLCSSRRRASTSLTRVSLKKTAGRVSDATPVVLSLVAGAIVPKPGPQLVAVESLEVQLRRGDELLGRPRATARAAARALHVRAHRSRAVRRAAAARELRHPRRRVSPAPASAPRREDVVYVVRVAVGVLYSRRVNEPGGALDEHS